MESVAGQTAGQKIVYPKTKMPPSFCETSINLQKNNKFSEQIPHARPDASSPSKKESI
jgi:hypothetical protein